jgi:hypothetical protein
MIERTRPMRLRRDYMVNFLRSQLRTLQNVLETIENHDPYDAHYIVESMKRIEKNIHRFRRSYNN